MNLPSIRAIIFDYDGLKAEIREIDENLCRADLSPAEEAEAKQERHQVHEAMHPQTGWRFR